MGPPGSNVQAPLPPPTPTPPLPKHRQPWALTCIEHARAVQDLRDHPALALAQRPADVHAHGVAHVAVVALVVRLSGEGREPGKVDK